MHKNIFEMGANFGADDDKGWRSDNKDKPNTQTTTKVKEPNKHKLHFAKEKRRGKTVTIVKPFYLHKAELQALLKTLKKKLGTGGAVKDNTLEFQGDISSKIRTALEVLNYTFKR